MKLKFIRSLLIGASVSAVFVVLITIAGELYKVTAIDGKVVNPIKDFLKNLHGHHWVGKGIWMVIVFFASSLIVFLAELMRSQNGLPYRALKTCTIFLLLGTLALYGFFTFEYLVNH